MIDRGLKDRQTRGGQGKWLRFLKRIVMLSLLVVVMTSVGLVAAELFLRWLYRDVLSSADGSSYFSIMHRHLFEEELNSFHLRGKQFEKSVGQRFRIVVLGDSLTWAPGVYPAEKRFTERLEKNFNEQSSNVAVEVVNAGRSGHDLPQHYKSLSFIDSIHPDLVLYQWFVNDMDVHRDVSRFSTPGLIKKRNHVFLFQRSALYFLIHRAYGQLRQLQGKQISYTRYLTEQLGDDKGKNAMDAQRILSKLISHFQDQRIPFAMVLFPSFAGPMNDYPLNFLHEQVLSVCKEKQVDCLDLRKTYESSFYKDLWANPFDPHPGELAHEMAAKAIYGHFGASWQQDIGRVQPRPERYEKVSHKQKEDK